MRSLNIENNSERKINDEEIFSNDFGNDDNDCNDCV
jgi:hypothetical protein